MKKQKNRIRILGIDPGTRRMGLAISGPLGITAQGLKTYDSRSDGKFMPYLSKLVEHYDIGKVILGKPLSMSGGEIEGTRFSESLARNIRDKVGVEVILRDERMTSLSAENVLEKTGRIKDSGDIDRLAAIFILQDYLDERNA